MLRRRRWYKRATVAAVVIHEAARLFLAKCRLARTAAALDDARAGLAGAHALIKLGEAEAARSVQARVRGYLARLRLRLEDYSAAVIQRALLCAWQARVTKAAEAHAATQMQRMARGHAARKWCRRFVAARTLQMGWRSQCARTLVQERHRVVTMAERDRRREEDAAVDDAGEEAAAAAAALVARAGAGPQPGATWASVTGVLAKGSGKVSSMLAAAKAGWGGDVAGVQQAAARRAAREQLLSAAASLRSEMKAAVVGVQLQRDACGMDLARVAFDVVDATGLGVLDAPLIACLLRQLQVTVPDEDTLASFTQRYHFQQLDERRRAARLRQGSRGGESRYSESAREAAKPAWLGEFAVLDWPGVRQLLAHLEGERTWDAPLAGSNDHGIAGSMGARYSPPHRQGSSGPDLDTPRDRDGQPLFAPSTTRSRDTLLNATWHKRLEHVSTEGVSPSDAWYIAVRQLVHRDVVAARKSARERFRGSGTTLTTARALQLYLGSSTIVPGVASDAAAGLATRGPSGRPTHGPSTPAWTCSTCGRGFVLRRPFERHRCDTACKPLDCWVFNGAPASIFAPLLSATAASGSTAPAHVRVGSAQPTSVSRDNASSSGSQSDSVV